MCSAYNKVAGLQKESGAIRSTQYALETEKIHTVMHEKAEQAVEAGKGIEISEFFIARSKGRPRSSV